MSLNGAISAHATGHYVVIRTAEGHYQDGLLVAADDAADLVATVVDDIADTVTVAAHGLATGDGPFRMLDARAQLGFDDYPALPQPVIIEGSYWVIVIDDDTLQLAASQSDAMGAIAIDLEPFTGTFKISTTNFMAQMSMQPLETPGLATDEEIDRINEGRLAILEPELRTRGASNAPDVVMVDGERYTVVAIDKFEHWGETHYECTLRRDRRPKASVVG